MRQGHKIIYRSVFCGMLVLVGCKNDVDLVFQGDPVPLVYGIISPEDSIHSVRISLTKPGDASQEGLAVTVFQKHSKVRRYSLNSDPLPEVSLNAASCSLHRWPAGMSCPGWCILHLCLNAPA
jgi:hypothetical protein